MKKISLFIIFFFSLASITQACPKGVACFSKEELASLLLQKRKRQAEIKKCFLELKNEKESKKLFKKVAIKNTKEIFLNGQRKLIFGSVLGVVGGLAIGLIAGFVYCNQKGCGAKK